MGTVIGIGKQGGFLTKEGKLPKINRVLLVDSLGALFGGAASASSVTSYIESAAGVAVGGRTGLASVVCGLFFLGMVFFAPLAEMIGGGVLISQNLILYPITAPALIMVGFFMMRTIKDIPWDELEEALPAFLTILIMPLTFSISHGIGCGFIAYTLLKIFRGKIREVHPLMLIVSILFAISFSPLVPK
jgi:AGZA family xanthine/uracil permease-like MFS transporter